MSIPVQYGFVTPIVLTGSPVVRFLEGQVFTIEVPHGNATAVIFRKTFASSLRNDYKLARAEKSSFQKGQIRDIDVDHAIHCMQETSSMDTTETELMDESGAGVQDGASLIVSFHEDD